jgi:integrase
MKLSSAIDNYVALKRSLGAVFSVDARILRSFHRAPGDISPEAIALRLRPSDVNVQDRVLSVRNTEFFKSRLVPVGASLATALARYSQQRPPLCPLQKHHPNFFTTRTGMAVRLGLLEAGFVRLRKRAGIGRLPAERWQPRLHDLRATFAVHLERTATKARKQAPSVQENTSAHM